jgi:predicted NACHT family NTPase
VLVLEKFNDDQIRKVLSFQALEATIEIVMNNPQLLDLAIPMLDGKMVRDHSRQRTNQSATQDAQSLWSGGGSEK